MFGGFGGMFGGGGMGGGSRFEASYRCYPVSFLDKPEAERKEGDLDSVNVLVMVDSVSE